MPIQNNSLNGPSCKLRSFGRRRSLVSFLFKKKAKIMMAVKAIGRNVNMKVKLKLTQIGSRTKCTQHSGNVSLASSQIKKE